MRDDTGEMIRVRAMAGNTLLSIPRISACDLKIIDLKRQLLEITENKITDDIVPPAVVSLKLLHGLKSLDDSRILVDLWPQDSKFLDVDVIVQKAVGKDDISFAVCHLLSKLDYASVNSITGRLARIEVTTLLELEAVAAAIVCNVLARPAHSEAYADLAIVLQRCYPEMPSEEDGQRPSTFKHVLLNSLQEKYEYEGLISAGERHYSNSDLLSLVRFSGHLYNRHFCPHSVIGQIVWDLIGRPTDQFGFCFLDKKPGEHLVLCACEIVEVSSRTLCQTYHGKALWSSFILRLQAFLIDCTQEIRKRIDDASCMPPTDGAVLNLQ